MSEPEMNTSAVPVLRLDDGVWRVAGQWNVQSLSLPGSVRKRRALLKRSARDARWAIDPETKLDSIGAQLLWHQWGRRLPEDIELDASQRQLFSMLANAGDPKPLPREAFSLLSPIRSLGNGALLGWRHGAALLQLFGGLAMDFLGMLANPFRGPWKEISAQIFRAGAQALGITALVGFLIGVVISYLSAQQLALFGAGQFIVKLLGVTIVRELGPVLAAILVAGRSGSSITAQIGVMRVTQELDAMEVMGISRGQRLILPRVIALAVVMPLLVLWTDVLAMIGGMVAAHYELGLQVQWFVQQLPDAVGLTNYWIGLIKGSTFGAWIALVACHFGLRIEPNTESLGKGTTASVVTAITGVILIDALYAVIFSHLGL